MKKLMMFAAASIVAGSVSAITFTQNPDNCGGSTPDSACEFVGFDFTEKGKLADYIEKKGYKTTTSFSAKGALGLVFEGDSGSAEEGGESGAAGSAEDSTGGTSGSATSGGDSSGTDSSGSSSSGGDSSGSSNSGSSSSGGDSGEEEAGSECCFAPGYATLVLKVKVAGQNTVVAFDQLGLTKLSFFGKKWEKVTDALAGMGNAGKYYSVESDLGFLTGTRADGAINGENLVYFDGEEEPIEAFKGDSAAEIDEPIFIYSGFGKAKIGLTKKGTKGGNCNLTTTGCDPEVIFKKYKGWFAGYYPTVSDASDLDFTCESGCDYAIFGGTWTAKFNKKYTTKARMLQKFGVKISEE